MATAQTPKSTEPAAAPKAKRTPTSMVERMKAQLSVAALKAKITPDELSSLEVHVTKLKSLLS